MKYVGFLVVLALVGCLSEDECHSVTGEQFVFKYTEVSGDCGTWRWDTCESSSQEAYGYCGIEFLDWCSDVDGLGASVWVGVTFESESSGYGTASVSAETSGGYCRGVYEIELVPREDA